MYILFDPKEGCYATVILRHVDVVGSSHYILQQTDNVRCATLFDKVESTIEFTKMDNTVAWKPVEI